MLQSGLQDLPLVITSCCLRGGVPSNAPWTLLKCLPGHDSGDLTWLQDLPPDIRFLLIARATPSKVPTGHEICQQGDEAASVWLLQDGEGCACCKPMLPVCTASGGAVLPASRAYRLPWCGCHRCWGLAALHLAWLVMFQPGPGAALGWLQCVALSGQLLFPSQKQAQSLVNCFRLAACLQGMCLPPSTSMKGRRRRGLQ